MKQVMYDAGQVKDMILKRGKLVLAADEKVLRKLPRGEWIAGTIPYFMADEGGMFSQSKIFVTELPSYVKAARICRYDEKNIQNVYLDAPHHGFSLVIISASSQTHKSFSLNAPGYKGFAAAPLIGWISGVSLDELGKVTPKVFDGLSGKVIENGAVVLHVSLPDNKAPEIGIVNIFKQGAGDAISFPEDTFKIKDAFVNGKKVNFSEYLVQNKVDTKLPMVANLYGAMVNVSFQKNNQDDKTVDLYAPVFKGVEYKVAQPVGDYVKEFTSMLPKNLGDSMIFSCNCILNYLYSQLEGKKTADIVGPITFGEVAYQLLNQTLAYLTIKDLK